MPINIVIVFSTLVLMVVDVNVSDLKLDPIISLIPQNNISTVLVFYFS